MSGSGFKIPTIYKSDKKSNEYRLLGNQEFLQKNWFEALALYNSSIAYANSNSALALGYGNRSAVYFETKLYEHCLENIQLARKNGYPAEKQARLADREAKCLNRLSKPKDENAKDFWDFFKLSYPANEKIPWIVDCVEMKWTRKFGRGIYAKQDLKAGDVICVEEPIFNFTKEGWGHYQCFNCFKANALNLLPSDYTASIMFCSLACKHKVQSTAVNKNDMASPDMKLLSEVSAYFGGYKQFDEYINRINLNRTFNKSIFDYDFSDPNDPKYEENRINCLLSLCTNHYPVENQTEIKNYVSKKTAHHLVSLYAINQKLCNMFDGTGDKEDIGNFISLFTSLINHACVGNVNSIVVEGKAVTIVEKPIKAGEQIFESYTGIGALIDKTVKKNLELAHMFTCTCKGCTKDEMSSLYSFEGGIFDLMRFSPPMYRHDYDYVKECLEEARDDINENPEDNAVLSSSLITSIMLMECVGFHLSYPFV